MLLLKMVRVFLAEGQEGVSDSKSEGFLRTWVPRYWSY